LGAVAHFADVTARKVAEDALLEEVSLRRLLVDQSLDGIVLLSKNGNVVESNVEFARMLGYSMEEMSSLNVSDWEADFSREQLQMMLDNDETDGAHFVTRHRRKDGSFYEVEISSNATIQGGVKFSFCVCRDISQQKQAEREREALIADLQSALAELKVLRGIIPVCSFCKKVRDDKGYWEQVEVYITKNSEADVSHGICPECLRKHFPGIGSRPVSTRHPDRVPRPEIERN
jgi:PAS domain S-box-containing protein